MPEFQTYKNHETMNIASEIMRQDFAIYELEGGQYDGVAVKLMAERVVFSCMPHIMDYLHSRVIVEAMKAHLLQTPEPVALDATTPYPSTLDKPAPATIVRPIDGLHVEAKFKNIEFQPTIKREAVEGYTGSLIIEDYDLFAVMQPQYFDPDPGELVFVDTVMVPFGEVTHFEPSERRAA